MMRIWAWPIIVALLSVLGLVAGLVSEGLGDWLSWASLGVPVVIGCHGLVRGRASKPERGAAAGIAKQQARS
ncbi:hypothetical protein CXK94_02065 [Stutzerimonas stutzeri]|uniref:DUF4175 domain-containing protein n=1 Tax=Stutzerimonas stutzeri TaxID=316 RepID=A0A2N8T9F3_STUST|nr:hypothetical protein [Stutzerimonas stutzeri]MCQ4325094.1 hypothetical protein [Stutzerimonas stutzeri]PNG11384.1 hypothetical protein CXK94_02065 [Stutzerimonas stutzeri]